MKEEKNAPKKTAKKTSKKPTKKGAKVDIEEVNLEEMMKKKKTTKGKLAGKQTKGKKEETTTKKKRKMRMRTKVILALLLLLLIAGSVLGYTIWKNGGGIKGAVVTAVGGKDEQKLKDLPPLQFLLLGKSDFMTDTIMVCSYDPKTQQASMLSVPRDTFIGKDKEKARASDKINSRYQLGVDKTLLAINRVTGMEIPYYLVVDTDALVKLVDAMGGVEFDVPIDMDYDDESQDLYIHLKAGKQKLNGDQAEQVLRFRHNNNGTTYPQEYGEQDLGRMRTQREFLQTAFKQFFTLSNLFNINKFIDIAESSIETNLDFKTLKDYVPYAVDFKTDYLVTYLLHVTQELLNKVWVYIFNKKQATEVVTTLFGEEAIKTPIQDGAAKTSTPKKNNTTTNKVTSKPKNETTTTTQNPVTSTVEEPTTTTPKPENKPSTGTNKPTNQTTNKTNTTTSTNTTVKPTNQTKQ